MINKPQLADNIDAGVDQHNRLHFIYVNSRKKINIDADENTIHAISLMDGKHTIEEIVEALGPPATTGDVETLVSTMAQHRLIREADTTGRSDDGRFARQLAFFADFTDDSEFTQRRLRMSKVAIIGCGTIGSGIAAHLARAGVGLIRICDNDVVSESNLSRNALFANDDIGNAKTDAAAKHLTEISQDLTVEARGLRISCSDDVHHFATGCDLLVNCADEPSVGQTSEWAARAAMKLKMPHILAGGYRTHLGVLGPTVIPGQSACWKCFDLDYHENDPFGKDGWRPINNRRPSGGSLGPLAAVVAGIHAWEAIRILTGISLPAMLNQKAEIDFSDLSMSMFKVSKRPDCPECTSLG